jgi:hypothetical protein
VVAGLFPGRREVAIDVTIHLEQVFDKAYFSDALESIFANLGPAQAMFGAANASPSVSALLDAAQSIVAFDMSISTGIKVENAFSVFSGGSGASSGLFFRLENLGVFAEATVDSVDNLAIFPGVTVDGGNFLLSAGVRIAAPFEGEVTMSGAMASQIDFENTLPTLPFKPYGQLRASLPFQATVIGNTQSLTIKFEDDNLFDDIELLTKIDFPVCPVVSLVSSLLGKLGSLGLSPRVYWDLLRPPDLIFLTLWMITSPLSITLLTGSLKVREFQSASQVRGVGGCCYGI